MEFELNLLENSYDYLKESLEYYKNIGYNETHDPDRDSVEEKIKWKTTFLLLVQAVELLIKEKLSRINPILIYSDIDNELSEESKTITYKKSIDRLINLKPNLITKKEVQFLNKCGTIRNECVHFKIKLNSIDIKQKYCKLFELYIKLHSKFFNKKYTNNVYKNQIAKILKYAKGFVVYRGMEYTKQEIQRVKKDYEIGQKNCYLYNKKEIYERIRYGDEPYLLDILIKDRAYAGANYYYNLRYCGDCLAQKGEYHMIGCDCEICPKCGRQLISCNCFEDYCDNKYLEENEKKEINFFKAYISL